jgi:site-specific DNA-methyltransferase (adenine-specific)
MWEHLKRIIKPDGAIVLTASQPFTSNLIMSNPKMFKYCWTWRKNKATGFLNAKKQPLRQIEELVVFYKKQCTYNPQKTTGHKPVNSFTKHTGDGQTMGKTRKGFKGGGQTDRYPTNLIQLSVVNNDNSGKDKFHPTQKPVALMEYMIKTYSNKGDVVLDFAAGSFTTGVACLNLGRGFIGIEKSKKYFDIGAARMENTSVPLSFDS